MMRKFAAFLTAAALLAGAAPWAGAVSPKQSAVTWHDNVQRIDDTSSGTQTEVIVELVGASALSSPEEERDARRAEIFAEQETILGEIAALTGTDSVTAEYRFFMTVNAVAVIVPYDALEEIRALPGVADAHAAERFAAPESTGTAYTAKGDTTADMVGAGTAWAEGYDGAGTVVAVIDTGLDLDHPAFAAEPDPDTAALSLEDVEDVLVSLNAGMAVENLGAEDVYYSGKVPFAFNYADGNTDATHDNDRQGDHGTHVAGIIAANGADSEVTGLAPEAQLLIMKVFGENEDGASETVLLAALEDAVLLGADVINLSLGTPAGFSDGEASYTKAIDAAVDAGIIVCAAAGNEYGSAYGNSEGTNQSSVENVDIGTVSDPASLTGVLAVASVNSAWVWQNGVVLADGTFVGISDQGAMFGMEPFYALAGETEQESAEYEFVLVPGVGEKSDFAAANVKGKIAVIERGEITFSEKYCNACEAGAAAVLICNNEDGTLDIDLSAAEGEYQIPCATLTRKNGRLLADSAGADGTGTVTVPGEARNAAAEDGWQLSSFSSWGPAPDLKLKPELSAVGGNVYSATDDGTYGLMSGTSMAAPQLAAMAAVTLQYVRAEYGLDGADARDMTQTLLMNTAEPMRQADGVAYSPRKQGAGLADVGDAVTTPVLLTVKNSALPKAELGDDPGQSGTYRFTFTAYNLTEEAQSYQISAEMLTETELDGLMLQQARELDAAVTFAGTDRTLPAETAEPDAVILSVPAGGKTEVTVTVRLTETERQTLRESFPNGIYVEGYVTLCSLGDAPTLTIPMLAFFGDWSRGQLFETAYIAETEMGEDAEESLTGRADPLMEIVTGTESYLGMNPAAEDTVYLPARSNALNLTGGEGGVIENVILDLTRNAQKVTIEVLDQCGRILYASSAEHVKKTLYEETFLGMYPVVWSEYDESFGFDPREYSLRNGESITIRITGEKDASGTYRTQTVSIPAYIDSEAPRVLNVEVNRTQEKCLLTVTARDNCYLAGVLVLAADGETVLGRYGADQRTRGTSVSLEMDVTDVISVAGGQFFLCAMDYARNTTLYEVNVLEDGETSVLPDGALYAHYSGLDGAGWLSVDTGQPEKAQEAFLDYLGGIAAAETVGDYIFAASGSTLYAISAATFQPTEVCALVLEYGDEIVDLAYCRADGLLHALVRTGTEYALCTVDPLTEAVEWQETLQQDILSGYGSAAALACAPDGTLWLLAEKAAKNGEKQTALYERSRTETANGWKLREVLPVSAENAELSAAADQRDGTLYILCGRKSREGAEIVSAELYTWTAEGLERLGDMPALSYDGLILTGGSEVKFPADGDILTAALNYSRRHLAVGSGFALTVEEIGPWYVSGEGWQVRWASGDVTVAAVDGQGNVTARGVGETEITATLTRNDGGKVTARCVVTVEAPGELYARAEDGTWQTLDPSAFRQAEPAPSQLLSGASAAAYAVGAGADGQDVIYVLDGGETRENELCPVYTLYTYAADDWTLLEQRELIRTWFVDIEQMPEGGFADLTYDPYTGYLVAAAGQCLFAIDAQSGRFYMAADAAEQLGQAQFRGIAFDSDGNGWYLDSEGRIGTVDGYLAGAVLGEPVRVVQSGGEPASVSMEYDELTGRLWIVWGTRLYAAERVRSGYQITRVMGLSGGVTCLIGRHYPGGKS